MVELFEHIFSSRNIIKGTIYLLLGVVFFVLSLKSIFKFNEWSVYTETNVVSQNEARFPAMTFCPLSNGYKEDVLKKNGIQSVDDYNYKQASNWSSNDTDINNEDLFESSTFAYKEIVKKIRVRTILENENGEFWHKIGEIDLETSINEKRHRKYGRCYTYYPDASLLKLGVYYMEFYFKIDALVYFHAKDQFLDLSGRLANKIHLGQQYETQITFVDVYELDYKNVQNGVIFYESDRKCSYESYDDCIQHTLTKAMMEETEDHCTVPWILGNNSICAKTGDMKKSFNIWWTRVTNQKKDCLRPCHTTIINLGAKNDWIIKDNSSAQLVAYFSSSVVKNREHYVMSITMLAGQIGGYVGLLRFILTIMELIEFESFIERLAYNNCFEK